MITWSNLTLHQHHSCGLIYPLIYSLIIYILLIYNNLSVDDQMQHSGFYTSNACVGTNILQGKNIFHLLCFHSESKYPAATKDRLSSHNHNMNNNGSQALFICVSLYQVPNKMQIIKITVYSEVSPISRASCGITFVKEPRTVPPTSCSALVQLRLYYKEVKLSL